MANILFIVTKTRNCYVNPLKYKITEFTVALHLHKRNRQRIYIFIVSEYELLGFHKI